MIEKYSYGEYVIVYNGQIYNTKELKEVLLENGFPFNGHCDTEILLKSYIHYGSDVVNHLNGIFAFAIWNSRKKELFMARDHFGVKPLFYTIKNNSIIFGSEIKALFEYPGIEKILDKSFMNCVNTTKISLPSTLKSVGKFAFYSCGKLEELIFPT